VKTTQSSNRERMADLNTSLCVLDYADVAATSSRSHTQFRRLLAFDRLDRQGYGKQSTSSTAGRRSCTSRDLILLAMSLRDASDMRNLHPPVNLYDDTLRSTKACQM
jgi:hypothetical protein